MVNKKRSLDIFILLFKDSLLKNSIFLMATSFIQGTVGFFFWIIAARYYTPNDVGITSAIFSSISLIAMVGSLGLYRALIYYLPRASKTDKILSSSLSINLGASIIFSFVFISGSKFWAPELFTTLNSLIGTSIFLIITVTISISQLLNAVFTAGRRSSFCMIKDSVYNIMKIFPLFILVKFGTIGILASLGFGLFLAIVIGFFLLFKLWHYKPRLGFDPIIKSMTFFSAGNYISDILYSLPILVFPIMILNTISARSAGYFYISIMMTSLLYGISQSIANSFLVESAEEGKFWENVNKSIKFNIIILIPGILLYMILGKFVLNLFNSSYGDNAISTLFILTITSIPLSLISIFNAVKNAQNKVMSVVIMNFIVASIAIALSSLLVKFNIDGIAISYLTANIIGAMIVISRIRNPVNLTVRLVKDIKKDVLTLL